MCRLLERRFERNAFSRRIRHHQVENRKRIAQGAVRFLGYQVQGLIFGRNAFALRNLLKMIGDVADPNPVKIKDLASGKDGRDDFVFFRGSQDKYCVGRRFFQGFQKALNAEFESM